MSNSSSTKDSRISPAKSVLTEDEDDERFEDAQEPAPPRPTLDKKAIKAMAAGGDAYIEKDILDVEGAIDLFLNSNFTGAQNFLKAKYGESMYYTFGYSTILFLKALMTFDPADVQECLDCLEDSIQISSLLRKETSLISSFAGLFSGKSSKQGSQFLEMSKVERHAELVWAEAYLLKALLSLLVDSNLVAFVREGLKIRSAYTVLKSGFKFIRNVHREEGSAGFTKHKIDEHFMSGMLFGMGTFQLIFSTLPDRLIRIFELIGFGGNRQLAISCLETGARWAKRDLSAIYVKKGTLTKKKFVVQYELPTSKSASGGLRVFLNELSLFFYHVVISGMVQLPDTDMPLAEQKLSEKLVKYPDSFIFLGLKARLEESLCHPQTANDQFTRVIEIQKDWRNLTHICIWDLAFCKMALGLWKEAADCFETLLVESKWSPAVYAYLQGVCLYHADKIVYKKLIDELLESVPKRTRKIAGKSIPLEKFVSRKARKYSLQGHRLLLPGYEILYMWCGFDVLPPDRLSAVMVEIDSHLQDLDAQFNAAQKKTRGKDRDEEGGEVLPYETYYDDFCLARFLKGLATRELGLPTSATQVPCVQLLSLTLEPSQKRALSLAGKHFEAILYHSDEIGLDHWIGPFARFEAGQVWMRCQDFERAKRELKAAMNGGFLETETGQNKKKYSMEQNLHLRAHNCLAKLEVLERLAGGGGEETRRRQRG